MPSPNATPTPITPPRVPLIDPRTGLIDRAWYLFFLSLLNAATIVDDGDLGPSAESLIASYDAALMSVNQELQTLPPNQHGELQALIDEVRQQLQTLPQPNLGTLSSVNIDWVPYLGFDTAPPWIGTTAGQFWYDSSTGSFNAKMGNNNITQQVGEELFVYGKASAAITDSPLQIVYHTGTVGASSVITFAPTIAGITDVNAIVGVATEPIALNGFGRITNFGVVRGITTNGTAYGEVWADDDVIWYNPVTGNPTKVEPVAPNIKIQVGIVINAGSGGSGSFQVLLRPGSKLGGTDSNVQFGALANGDIIQYDSALQYWKNVPASTFGTGTVTSVSVVSANGFAGTVATATTTPAITMSTSISGLLYGNGTALAAATISAPLAYSAGTLSITQSGTASNGYLSSTDWNTFNNKQPAGTYVTSVTGTAPVVSSGGTTPAISMAAANTSTNGYLTSTDWNTFNNKQAVSAPVTKTADFSVAATDLWLINNKSGSSCTTTLPAASSYSGRVLHFQNYQAQTLVSASSNVVPLAGGAAGTSILLASAGDSATLVSDGSNWLMTQYVPNNILLLE